MALQLNGHDAIKANANSITFSLIISILYQYAQKFNDMDAEEFGLLSAFFDRSNDVSLNILINNNADYQYYLEIQNENNYK